MNIIYKILIFLCLFYPGILLYYYGFNDSQGYYEIIPNWFHDMERNQLLRNRNIDSQASFRRSYYYNKEILAYYNGNGLALHKILPDSKTLISPDNDFYLVYPRLGEKIEMFNKRGEKQWSLDTYAIPFFTPFRKNIVLMSSDQTTLTVYDYNRNSILPTTYLGSLITDYALCENNDGIILGNMEGDIYYFDHQVKQVFKKNFQDSRYRYIKSVVCSPSGTTFLTLDGLYPEWLTFLNSQGVVLWRKTTDQDRRSKTDIFIDENNGLAVDVHKRSIHFLSLRDGRSVRVLPIDPELGEIKRTVFDSSSEWLLIGLNGERGHQVLLLNRNMETVWKNSLIDEYLIYAELYQHETQIDFLIHSVRSMYSYRLAL